MGATICYLPLCPVAHHLLGVLFRAEAMRSRSFSARTPVPPRCSDHQKADPTEALPVALATQIEIPGGHLDAIDARELLNSSVIHAVSSLAKGFGVAKEKNRLRAMYSLKRVAEMVMAHE